MLDSTNVNVLLIEDDPSSIRITKDMLKRVDNTTYNIDVAGTLKEGIYKINESYDVILLDLILPNGQGLEVFKRVKNSCDLPIVIVSGHEDKALECVKHGAQDYLVKPYYSSDALSRSIRYAIERHRSDKHYKTLVDGTNAIVYGVDLKTQRYTFMSDAGCKKIGYDKDELMEMSPFDLLTPSSKRKWERRFEKIKKGIEVPKSEEFEVVTRDGHILWALTTAEYIFHNGELVQSYVVAIDITEHKLKEKQLESIYSTAPVGLGLIQGDRVLTQVNTRLCDMLGYEPDELIGQNLRFVYPSEYEYERVGKLKYTRIEETGIGVVETQFQRKDGDVIDILLTSSYLEPQDRSRGVTFSALDITHTKEIEREIERRLNERIDQWKMEKHNDVSNLTKLDYIISN